jgi:hypothetical protein
MEQLLPLLEKYGVWVAILAIVAYFLVIKWWPYWREQDQAERTEKRNQMDRMLNLQEVSMKEMVDAIRANTHQSEKVSEHMEALTDEVRRSRP